MKLILIHITHNKPPLPPPTKITYPTTQLLRDRKREGNKTQVLGQIRTLRVSLSLVTTTCDHLII